MPTILITGASGGLAQEMVKLLPNDQLILLGRNKEKLAQLYGNYSHAELIEIDITDDSALEALVTDLYLRYGKIDVLINNAGYGILRDLTRLLIKIFTRCLRSIPLPWWICLVTLRLVWRKAAKGISSTSSAWQV